MTLREFTVFVRWVTLCLFRNRVSAGTSWTLNRVVRRGLVLAPIPVSSTLGLSRCVVRRNRGVTTPYGLY